MLNSVPLKMPVNSRNWLRWPVMLAMSALLCACGFHLRGSANLPFKSIYMTFAPTSPLGIELKRNIVASGNTAVLPKEDGAEATLQVLSETREKVILTLNSSGRPSEYMLYYRLTFRVIDAQKKELLAPTLITLKRDISYNSSQELSKDAEEVLLYRDMQSDMVQQILRRLTAIKTAQPTQPAQQLEPAVPASDQVTAPIAVPAK
ncbi:LPS-assembly lipoprotein RlpB precursor (Rare lipoprotein B) [Collimonas arenae]|uniref:LPS-assembly lipoprotein LptE n=1 Tax=Collimonas arenae TaxID=279058 RepID=A0A0A1FFP9_9BURK|nr:LPS assembly lipoprotein LptE [Collimonas arenae]AIY43568.1 LPS-assembly lipoprotein RlpB precursor (Rare lipoprotein B) [Collimonas arenae]